jgi:hypothetical protein
MFNENFINDFDDIFEGLEKHIPFNFVVDNNKPYSYPYILDPKLDSFVKAMSREIKIKMLINDINETDLNIAEDHILQLQNNISNINTKNFNDVFYSHKNIKTFYLENKYNRSIYNDYTNHNLKQTYIQNIINEIIKQFVKDVECYNEYYIKYNNNKYDVKNIGDFISLLKKDSYIIIPNKVRYKYNDIIEHLKRYKTNTYYLLDCDLNNIIICNYIPIIKYNMVILSNPTFDIVYRFKFGIVYPTALPFLDYCLY